MKARRTGVTIAGLVAALVLVGCVTPADHSYVTDYQVVGDKTVKYIYLPGEQSTAQGPYLDQALAVEICSIEPERADDEDEVDDLERGEAVIETDCRRTRLLRTEEYR